MGRALGRTCRKCGADEWVSKIAQCAVCNRAREQWRRAQPEYTKARNLRRNHGITVDDLAALMKKQGGRCAICGKKPQRAGKPFLVMDHNHATEKRRGLLCVQCNVGIGLLQDSVDVLLQAAKYLTTHGG